MKETAPKNNVEESKPRPSLLPMDVLITYLCPAYEDGIIKYSRESWRKGFLVSDMIDAAERHIDGFFWKRGPNLTTGRVNRGNYDNSFVVLYDV